MGGKHTGHLPKQHLNKGVAHNTKASPKTLKQVAARQGEVTKKDAKAAKAGGTNHGLRAL
jgi:hypothetical protein